MTDPMSTPAKHGTSNKLQLTIPLRDQSKPLMHASRLTLAELIERELEAKQVTELIK